MISASNINKYYHIAGKRTEVLRGVSLEIAEGEFVAVAGRSGSGKSTLLNVLSTLVRPDGGELYYRLENLGSASPSRLNTLRQSDFAVIFQFHHLLPYLTVLQNTLLPFMQSMRPVCRDTLQKATEILERVGLADKGDRLPGKLSGGEQQRVAIARAMVKSARVLFADEPTGSLDKTTGEGIIDLLGQLRSEGMTVIMVTHEPEYASRADRVVEISDGRVAR